MEATGDRRAGTQSRRGSPAKQSGLATQTTRSIWTSFFTREGRRQGAKHLLIDYQQFLQAGVKVKTLEFLKEILLSMGVALSGLPECHAQTMACY